MGQFAYICEKCGGGEKRCCSDDCEEEDCKGGQCCWSEKAVCVIDAFNIPEILIMGSKIDYDTISEEDMNMLEEWGNVYSRKDVDKLKKVFDAWKGVPLKMTYNAEGAFTCDKIPGIEFQADASLDEGERFSAPGVHVKACCEKCWTGDKPQ